MGRKDKLRREKQARRKIENTASVATTTAQATLEAATTEAWHDAMFPKSELYVQAGQCMPDVSIDKFLRGANEYGCIHSMTAIGNIYTLSKFNRRHIHFGLPWFLEGSIRGSFRCTDNLLAKVYYKSQPRLPEALMSYWMKMSRKYHEWSGSCDSTEGESIRKSLKDNVVKRCAICFKQDTETLTLRQCMGCSMYCYCSEECQTIHYNDNHGGECRQLRILNKYHKPYAKEIRKAAICGESHPALEKLRQKVGLIRPIEEYQQFCDATTNIYEGRPINPYEFLIARTDGTVWIGSTPMNPLGPSATTAIVSTEGDQSSTL